MVLEVSIGDDSLKFVYGEAFVIHESVTIFG